MLEGNKFYHDKPQQIPTETEITEVKMDHYTIF